MSKILVTILLIYCSSLNANVVNDNELLRKIVIQLKEVNSSSCKTKQNVIKKVKKVKKAKAKKKQEVDEVKVCKPTEKIVYLYGDLENFSIPKKEVEINNLLWNEPYSVIPLLNANDTQPSFMYNREPWFTPQNQYYFISKPTAPISNTSIHETPITSPIYLMMSAFIYFFAGRYFCNRKKPVNPYV